MKIYVAKIIYFTKAICPLLGYSPTFLEANKLHVSDQPVDIIKVNVIYGSNISWRDVLKTVVLKVTLFEFRPSVSLGFKIVETPHNVIYLPVNVKGLENRTVRLCDQDNQVINLSTDETVNIRLHLKIKMGLIFRDLGLSLVVNPLTHTEELTSKNI